MTTHQVTLPDFFAQCPYAHCPHPLSSYVSLRTQDWVLNEISFDEQEKKAFLKICGGLLGGYCYPDTSEYHVQVCGDWMDWAFCLDDMSDKFTPAQAQTVVDSIKECMQDPIGCQNTTPICRLAKE